MIIIEERKCHDKMNEPISEVTIDEIGMNVYVDYLESALEKGADMSAVVFGFALWAKSAKDKEWQDAFGHNKFIDFFAYSL